MKKTFIWGGKSKCRLLIPYLKKIGRNPDYIFDPYITYINFNFKGLHLKKEEDIKKYTKDCDSFIVAIGGENGRRRDEIARLIKREYGLNAISLKHDHSYICNTSLIGEGLMMMPGSVINSYSKIGDNCIFNTNSSVDHECNIGNGVHIMGGAVVTGRVFIDNYATIGSNATILPDLKIGEGALIGAGAVVTKNVSKGEIVVGIPARPIKKC